jgi:hypothetical protein
MMQFYFGSLKSAIDEIASSEQSASIPFRWAACIFEESVDDVQEPEPGKRHLCQ